MIDVIVYKPYPYGLVFIHDTLLGLRPRVYHLSHKTWTGLCVLMSCNTYCDVLCFNVHFMPKKSTFNMILGLKLQRVGIWNLMEVIE